MAGKRTKSRKNLSAKKIKTFPSTQADEQQTWSMLPTDILELIFVLLTLKDNIRASAVCKTWQGVGISVRISDRPPWLMIFPKFGDSFEFYDPSKRKSYWLELPELSGCTVCYAHDGWLLLVKTFTVFFFCPYTRESIKLPFIPNRARKYAFSASPKSPSCIVFAVENGTTKVRTYRHGATRWSMVNYPNMVHYFNQSDKVIFSKGCFYCVDIIGWMGIYNPNDQCWLIHLVPAPNLPGIFSAGERHFVAEYDGEIYIILTSITLNPIVYWLNKRTASYSWVEMESLEGITLFANYLPSHGRKNPSGLMMSSVCFPKIQFHGKKCVSYSLDHERYYPRKLSFDWSEHYDSLKSLWIEAPEDLSAF